MFKKFFGRRHIELEKCPVVVKEDKGYGLERSIIPVVRKRNREDNDDLTWLLHYKNKNQ